MESKIRILAFAGSLRRDSWNKKLAQVGAQAARDAGAEVTYIDLREFPMPIYDEDLERAEGLPEGTKRFRELMFAHQGLLIASPENNSSITSALKNTIDWATREEGVKGTTAAFQGKVAGLLAGSPGIFGGVRGLLTLRSILGNIGVLVVPEQATVPKVHEAFDASGKLKDPKTQAAIEKVGARLVHVASALAAVAR
jgi:NAD(P)H-dependent FMN reductase